MIPTPGERNHLVDLARIGSVAIVVVFHTLLWQIRLEGGALQVVPWAPGPALWFLSWFLAIIPVFFAAAGFANTVIVDTATRGGTSYPRFLVERGTRLVGPLTAFGCFFTVASSIPAWLGFGAEAMEFSRLFAQLLWFLVVYLVLLLASPLLVAAFDRWGWLSFLPFAGAAVLIDLVVRLGAAPELQWWSLFAVWPLVHQWGIAYHRGWFRTWSASRNTAVILAAAAGILTLVLGLGYPPAAVAWADVLVANLLPPTCAAALMGLAHVALLGLLQHQGVARQLTRPGPVRALNALLITVYLWHIPVIVVAGGLLAGASWLFPGAAGVLLHPACWLLLTVCGLVVLVPRIAALEWRLIPTPAPNSSALSPVAFIVLLAGCAAVWQWGAVVHPMAPASTAAVALFGVGLWLVRRAAGSSSSHPRDGSSRARPHTAG